MIFTFLADLPKDCELPHPVPSRDTLTKDGILSVALVFEAQIFLAIQDIMGDDVKRGHQDLLRMTINIDKIMKSKAVSGEWDVGGTAERWHKRDVDVVMWIKMISLYWKTLREG